MIRYGLLAALAAMAFILSGQQSPRREEVGPSQTGGFLLNTGWRIEPAGRQIPLDTFPMATALSRDGQFLVVLHAGFNPPSLIVFETSSMKEVSRTPVADGWLGLTFSPDGKLLYVGGGAQASVYEFSFSDGKLSPSRTIPVVPSEKRTAADFVGDVALSPDGRLIYAAGLYRNIVHVINPQSGRVIDNFATGRRPYRILFHPDGRSYFVSSWLDGSVYHHNTNTGERLGVVRLGQHPTDMVWRTRKKEETGETQAAYPGKLFVSGAHTNNVFAIGVTEAKDLQLLETISVAMRPRQPLGMTPSALALSSDNNRLYVACSDANTVAVVDITEDRSITAGFIPAGWYPTAVRLLPGDRLAIVNGKGSGSSPSSGSYHAAKTQRGSISLVDGMDEQQLALYSKIVARNSPVLEQSLQGRPAGSPVPAAPGDVTPIKHVVYIVKEGRTYDQVLGDLAKGNGDPKLTTLGEKITPNQHKLANEFVLLDNFYVNGDVNADGYGWTMGGIASDYIQKTWPNTESGRRRQRDYEGAEPAAIPPTGYLWNNASAAGISMRNFGWFVNNTPKPVEGSPHVVSVRDAALSRVTHEAFRGFDIDYPDSQRADAFMKDLAELERTGSTLPQLTLIRLSNARTAAAVTDNDAALGKVVEAISRTKYWPATAIFVVEASADDGADHVDSHRAPAFIISPYTRRAAVDSSFYNTTSMLRTMELILGLQPMTIFDASAKPMWAAFSDKPDTRPFEAAVQNNN